VERLEQIGLWQGKWAFVLGSTPRSIPAWADRRSLLQWNFRETALKCRNVEVEGIFSHFANADAPDLTHARLAGDSAR
jgi:hypothetical protein